MNWSSTPDLKVKVLQDSFSFFECDHDSIIPQQVAFVSRTTLLSALDKITFMLGQYGVFETQVNSLDLGIYTNIPKSEKNMKSGHFWV